MAHPTNPTSTSNNTNIDDPFDTLLNLETQYHTEGYNLGVEDGTRAGRTEGRIFGLEKGFEKFVEMGKLNGRAAIWDARLPLTESESGGTATTADDNDDDEKFYAGRKLSDLRRPRNGSARLKKHIHRLQNLTDAATVSTENSEDAVAEFDDRLKDGRAKATLISKILGEDDTLFFFSEEAAVEKEEGQNARSSTTMRQGNPLRVKAKNESVKKKQTMGEMEDFVALPGMKKLSKE